jgi:hypothetical protein
MSRSKQTNKQSKNNNNNQKKKNENNNFIKENGQVKEDEMGRACSTNEGEEECI